MVSSTVTGRAGLSGAFRCVDLNHIVLIRDQLNEWTYPAAFPLGLHVVVLLFANHYHRLSVLGHWPIFPTVTNTKQFKSIFIQQVFHLLRICIAKIDKTFLFLNEPSCIEKTSNHFAMLNLFNWIILFLI